MRFIDLHTHTTCSDGSCTPSELLIEAKAAGLSAIAITDHDRIEALKMLKAKDVPEGLELVPGIEFSAEYDDCEIHIVGLYVDIYDKALNDALTALWEARRQRNLKIFDKFKKLHVDISADDFKGRDLSRISKAHFCDLLLKKGYATDFKLAFEEYFSPNGKIPIKRDRLSAKDTIALIRNSGGGAFLAHLNQIRTEDKEKIVKELLPFGLCGIEGIYPEYDEEMTAFCKMLSGKYNLLLSGGSDYHGIYKRHISLGRGRDNIRVPYEFLEKIKEQLKKT